MPTHSSTLDVASPKLLLLTFDYELFLGELSGTASQCLIRPTERLLRVLARLGAKAVFFVDTLYLVRLGEMAHRDAGCRADLAAVQAQIVELRARGHTVFPHLHPHWLDAEYVPERQQWRLANPRRYRVHALTVAERHGAFRMSVEILRRVLGEDSLLDGYRAGGWSIQPFDAFAPLFREFGIRYDFSVAPRRWSFTEGHWYDFTAVRDAVGPYRFGRDVTVPDAGGEFVEFPISVLETGKWSRRVDLLLRRSLHRLFLKPAGRGAILGAAPLPVDTRGYEDLYFLHLLSFETMRCPFIRQYKSFLRSRDYLHVISHPKLLSSENLFWAERLLRALLTQRKVETDFRTICRAYDV